MSRAYYVIFDVDDSTYWTGGRWSIYSTDAQGFSDLNTVKATMFALRKKHKTKSIIYQKYYH